MKRSSLVLLGLMVGLSVQPLLAQTPKQTNKPSKNGSISENEKALRTLQQEYNKEMKKYYEPYSKAKTEEESSKIHLDPDKNPGKKYLPKFQALAKQAKGTPTGLKSLSMVIDLLSQSGTNKKEIGNTFDIMVADYSQSPQLEQAIMPLSYMGYAVGEEKAASILKNVVEKSPHKSVKAAALYSLAEVTTNTPENQPKIKEMLLELQKNFPESRYAKMADGKLFEIENLSVGKVAPDIEGEDQNGEKFKLSDYRGKVVVLDFWGFW